MPRFDRLEFDDESDPRPGGMEPGSAAEEAERDADAWLRKADDHRRRGLYENSLRYYSRALEFDKSLLSGWVGQVQMLVLLGRIPRGRTVGEEVAGAVQQAWRPDGRPRSGAGTDRRSNGRLSSWRTRPCDRKGARPTAGWFAASCWPRRAMRSTATASTRPFRLTADWLVPLEIALIYLYHEQPSKALSRARQAVEKAPDRFYTWFIQGQCEQALGFDRQAKLSYERCLELSPRHVEASHKLAEVANQGWSLSKGLRRLIGR